MPKTKKKSRAHKEPRLGASSAEGQQLATADVNPDQHCKTVDQAGPFMSLPMDIFLEIATHCHPLDLLHLSRVSKKLREVVLTKRNRNIWVCARNGLDPPMPACPDDLSEPKYAFMVFERFCMLCGSLSRYLDHGARIQLCEECWDTNVKQGYTIIRELDLGIRRDRSLRRVICELLPEAVGGFRYYLLGGDTLDQTLRLKFYQPEVVAVAKEYCTVSQSSGGDSRVLEAYIEGRKARALERVKFHSALVKWGEDHARAQHEARIARAIDRFDRTIMHIRLTLQSHE